MKGHHCIWYTTWIAGIVCGGDGLHAGCGISDGEGCGSGDGRMAPTDGSCMVVVVAVEVLELVS
jgi:hypothetical protein